MAKLFGLALAATASFAAAATQDTHGLSWGQWGEWAPCDRLGQTTKRRRICQGQITNKALKKTRCLGALEGTNIQAKQCGKVDAEPMFVMRNQREDPNKVEWQEWQEWSKCNNGSQKRTRFCGKAISRGIMPSADCKEKSSTGFGSTKNKETRACSNEILRGSQATGYTGSSNDGADGRRVSNAGYESYIANNGNKLSSYQCYHNPGTPESVMKGIKRIVGGVVAEKGAHPHIAMLSYVGFGGYGQFCDGTIIHKRFILTAAHCFVGWDESASTYEVLLGAHSKMTTEEGQETYLLESIECHKEYKVTQRQILYDICILKTSEDIQFNKSVWPICLPDDTPPPNSEELAGMKCVVAGWGDTRFTGDDRVLNQVDVPVLTPETCQEWYNDNNILVDIDQHVCAGYEEGGRDACQGDSGGPFVCDRTDLQKIDHHMKMNQNQKILTGIVSFGVGCAQAKNPGVYTNINYFLPWIFDQINKHDDCYPSNPCKNGGLCLDNFHGHDCECPSGWTGPDCSLAEEDLTACHKNVCISGECILDDSNTSRGYTCDCDYGYGGPFCHIVTDNCVAINCNLGTCKLDASGEAQCICPQNWTGEFCATDVNECLDNPCAPGAGCDNIDGGYECSCPIGYEGDGTKEGTGCSDINECESGAHNCGPSSVCTNNQGGFKCSCEAGFTGNPPAVKCRQPDVGETCPNVVGEFNKLSNQFLNHADGSPRYDVECGINGQTFNQAELNADKTIRHPLSPSRAGAHTDNACIFKCKPGQMMSAPSFSKVNGGSAARIDCVNRAKGAALKPNKNQLRCHGCNPVDGVSFSDCQVKSKKMIQCNAECSSGGKKIAVKCHKKKGKFSWSSNMPKC